MAFGVCKSNLKRRRRVIGLCFHFLSTSLWLRVAVAVLTLAAVAALVGIGRPLHSPWYLIPITQSRLAVAVLVLEHKA
jgi:hypothetical protein